MTARKLATRKVERKHTVTFAEQFWIAVGMLLFGVCGWPVDKRGHAVPHSEGVNDEP